MPPIIQIQELSKEYNRTKSRPYISLRDSLADVFRKKKGRQEKFLALDDINIDINEGERIGIIGSNGAGKSTLLKIISRITPPTRGSVTIHGRVGSLLEVGTGFHPELSGRENIFLNGSILGLKKAEITRKLDAIIDFSGVEKFMDTPMKHFSSGMQLRLAFAVAAHLEPEILVIDEVLAVGDAEFQKKCIRKMEEVSKEHGRTILFVSHNMAAVKQLCTKGLLLENGRNRFFGDLSEAQQLYTKHFQQHVARTGEGSFDLREHPNKIKKNEALQHATIIVNGSPAEQFIPGSELCIRVKYFLETPLIDPEVGIVIKDDAYAPLIGLNNKHLGKKLELISGVEGEVMIKLPALNIYAPGKYYVDLYLGDQVHYYECLYDALEITVPAHDVYDSGIEPLPEWNRIFVGNMDIITLNG